MFKKTILCGFTIITMLATHAQTIKTPAPSTTQNVKQDFAVGSVELSYSRPNMKGRKIFGDLVPYGQVWRTGANSATTLNFSDEVSIGGTKVPAGKYGLLTIPGQNEWTVIITKQTDVTSPAAYKQESDVVRVKVKPMAIATPQETFTIQFANVKPSSTDLQIMWDKTAVSLPITADVDSKVMAQIKDAMSTEKPPYFQAAAY